MKFPRKTQVTRGWIEAAPWAAVMLVLVIFILLGNRLYTPGVHVQLPVTSELPGVNGLPVHIAIGNADRLFFEGQLVTSETALTNRWREIIKSASEKPVLIIDADKSVSYENLVRLMQLGRAVGFETTVLATLPRPFDKRSPAP
ncbi:MAG: Biopolymer transport protein ExbD/TolR [Verrucomicrobiota bacterium]|jgi:biopolymer transport protein ExbD